MFGSFYSAISSKKLEKAQNEVSGVFANPTTGEMQAYNCATQQHFIGELCKQLELENNPKHAKMLEALKKVSPSCDTIFELTNHAQGEPLRLQARERYEDAMRTHAMNELFDKKPSSEVGK